MFEFGRDLRKLFEKARESDDLGWLELIGADLVEAEARCLSVDAGRVSCARPFDAWMRASALWREHARRTGRASSLDHAVSAASDAARAALNAEHGACAALEAVEIHRQAYDLRGGPTRLETALRDLSAVTASRSHARAWAAALEARLRARVATLDGDLERMRDAVRRLDAALTGAKSLSAPMTDAVRLERAGLLLEAGLSRGDAGMLDEAGRELRRLVDGADPDQRPLTRASALAMAGAGLRGLAEMAQDPAGVMSGRALFDAAAEQFTPDHSPLDWVAVQLATPPGQASLAALRQCETLAGEPGLVLGALARERRVAAEAGLASAMGDLRSLAELEARAMARLRVPDLAPLDWAVEQIGLARLAAARARTAGAEAVGLGLVLAEAALTAREQGARPLADRAEAARRDCQSA